MEENLLAERFEVERTRLRGVAYRMLGSLAEADDALQEAWLRLSGTEAEAIESLPAWLTTVVGRICLNVLRSRGARPEVPLEAALTAARLDPGPEEEALLADQVGLALLVVLDRLQPAERLAFVLHDMFDVPFEPIAQILNKSAEATRQLASRARRRVEGSPVPEPDRARQARAVHAYLRAVRTGDLEALVAVLDPEVLLVADGAAVPGGVAVALRGSQKVARAAAASAARAPFARTAIIDGAVGIVVAPRGRLRIALLFTVQSTQDGERVTRVDVVADPSRLAALGVSVLEGWRGRGGAPGPVPY
ncbi:sigma-70 family RNA polymerase sigma factor [Sinomonas sp. ASV486]|uniref:sigma-70 family RNA polymerase sigma factor n=1 Tax=Sinomonas sp. ASV486 TaxID=3051170 RepID=UPI0027DC8462|nr:sigma-70 family RNA polymerase sigma factor [Sinomonas sp. ASV486]MDQ4491732.1 sigma-70 family RNA polymerase sigma factor [Sinomonas sp. ASV486]